MKQYEYETRFDKDLFEQGPHYHIEISTNNFGCYDELKIAVSAIINKYEAAESENDE